MLDQGFEVRLVSSVACARTREAIFNSRDKSDPKDTKVILYLLQSGITQRYWDPLAKGDHDLTRSHWFMRTFHCFPTPSSIVTLSEARFIAEAWELIGKKQWLQDLYNTALSSIGLPVALDSVAVEMYR